MTADKYRFPFLDLGKLNEPMFDELSRAASRVIRSGRYIGGEEVDGLARDMTSLTGTRFCLPVSNGLDALRLILRSYIEIGVIERGSEVILPANTFIATALAVTDVGLIPVFADPDPATMLIDRDEIRRLLSSRTAAVMPVDLFGRVWDDSELISELHSRGILIIEDSAQAIGAISLAGAESGSVGDASGFSFYPTKNAGALGDAGAVCTSDQQLFEIAEAFANYGRRNSVLSLYQGFNCRMDPVQAAMLRIKLRYLNNEIEARRRNAHLYSSLIVNPEVALPPDEPGMTYHQYVVRVADQQRFISYLERSGVQAAVHYSPAVHQQPCMLCYGASCPVAERLSHFVVSLPVSSATSSADVREIAAIINNFRT